MADFKINEQYAQVIQQGDLIKNIGTTLGGEELSTRVGLLLSRIDALLEAGRVDEANALPVRSALLEAAASQEPAERITALERAKDLASAAVGLATLVEGIDRVLSLIAGG